MLFHKEKKLGLFLPPKTGTQTARAFLKNIGWNGLPYIYAFPEEHLAKYPNLNGYQTYCFLRNPVDRFVSCILFLKQHQTHNKFFKDFIDKNEINASVENFSYEQVVDNFHQFKELSPLVLSPQNIWATLPSIEVLDFDNYEAEIRRISEDYTTPLPKLNASTDFGRSVVTQKVIDFVRQEYAADYALAKDRLGKEY